MVSDCIYNNMYNAQCAYYSNIYFIKFCQLEKSLLVNIRIQIGVKKIVFGQKSIKPPCQRKVLEDLARF